MSSIRFYRFSWFGCTRSKIAVSGGIRNVSNHAAICFQGRSGIPVAIFDDRLCNAIKPCLGLSVSLCGLGAIGWIAVLCTRENTGEILPAAIGA